MTKLEFHVSSKYQRFIGAESKVLSYNKIDKFGTLKFYDICNLLVLLYYPLPPTIDFWTHVGKRDG